MNRLNPYKILTATALAVGVAACGGGGGSLAYDPAQTMQSLQNKVAVNGVMAALTNGTPPAPNSTEIVTNAPSEVIAVVGRSVTIPVTITSNTTLDSLFAKIPGAATYFEVALTNANPATVRRGHGLAKSVRTPAKNATVVQLTVDVPANLEPGGNLCFELSASNISEQVSNVDLTCLSIQGSAPTAAPTATATATPTPSATTTATSTPSASATPTATATATATATPTATATASPSPTPTATPNNDSAAACLNPVLYTAGTRVEQVYAETYEGGSSSYDDSYSVEAATGFGNATVKMVFDEGGSDYLHVDTAHSRVQYFGWEDGGTSATFTPPFEIPLDLTPDHSFEQSIEVHFVDPDTEFDHTFTIQTSITYVGRETVTVPAGTFETCYFSQTTTFDPQYEGIGFGFDGYANVYFGVGNGLTIKDYVSGEDGYHSELSSATINGTPVTGN